MKKTNKKLTKKLIVLYILFAIFFGITLYSTIYFIDYKLAENKLNNQITEIQNIVKVEEIKNTEVTTTTKPINQNVTTTKKKETNNYTNTSLINVDFNELKKINNDVKGWIYVPNTKINYPFVQAKDNDYYLKHSFDKSSDKAGWVFLDYRNNFTTTSNDYNTILYAHNMKNKLMFGSLKTLLTKEWLNNPNNHVIKISTETENTLWQVFSVYHIKTTSDYLKINFKNDTEFNNFTKMLINRSKHNFNTKVNNNDKILTLSTCYTKNERLVVHAKLIKVLPKENK